MGKKNIVSIGFDFPGDFADCAHIKSRKSLSDADIVIFRPDYGYFYSLSQTLKGKPSLSEKDSFELVESMNHWSHEITDSLYAGKTIIVYLSELTEVYVDTGKRTYSGTGRNRQTTIQYACRNNYETLPVCLKFVNAEGTSLKLSQNSEILSSYWSGFSDSSVYKIQIEGEDIKRLVESRDGRKTLGGIVKVKELQGTIILLPDLDIDTDEFYTDDYEEWTEKGKEFGQKLYSTVLEIDKTIQSSKPLTPAPLWSQDLIYQVPIEEKLLSELTKLENKIMELEAEKEKLKKELSIKTKMKSLLYEKGSALEEQIVHALKLMGFTASPFKDSGSEFDVVFESEEGRFLGEAEGKDNRAINIDKLRQLEMNILEDFDRENVKEMAKGVLFGNAHRLLPLNERKEWFTAKCITAAKRNGIALVRVPDLFFITRYLSTKNNTEFAAQCRKAILDAQGEIVEFPEVPELAQAKKRLHDK